MLDRSGIDGRSDVGKQSFRNCDEISFFELTEELFGRGKDCSPFLAICGLMRKCGAQALLLHEHVELADEYLEHYSPTQAEIADLQDELGEDAEFSVAQVTFFQTRIRADAKRLPDRIRSEDILATCVIISILAPKSEEAKRDVDLRRSYVFEAIIAVPSVSVANRRQRLLNNYVHIRDSIGVIIGGREFSIEASYFCQQNGITAHCGQAAMKMALWHTSGFTEQPTTVQINEFARRGLGQSKRTASEAFHEKDIHNVCQGYGVDTIHLPCDKFPEVLPYEFAYLLVESGIPTVIIFISDKDTNGGEVHHVLPVIGHTWDSNVWLPWAAREYRNMSRHGFRGVLHEYVSSVEWVPQLIVHDDLLGPYMHIDSHSFPSPPPPQERRPVGQVRSVIGFVGKDMHISEKPTVVQEIGAGYFRGGYKELVSGVTGSWKERLKGHEFGKLNLVFRTQAIERSKYIGHLAKLESPNALNIKEELEDALPERLWMVEFSVPHLYSVKGRMLGEILLPRPFDKAYLDALGEDSGPHPPLFRMVDHVLLKVGGSVKKRRLSFQGHSPLYRRLRSPIEF